MLVSYATTPTSAASLSRLGLCGSLTLMAKFGSTSALISPLINALAIMPPPKKPRVMVSFFSPSLPDPRRSAATGRCPGTACWGWGGVPLAPEAAAPVALAMRAGSDMLLLVGGRWRRVAAGAWWMKAAVVEARTRRRKERKKKRVVADETLRRTTERMDDVVVLRREGGTL